MFKFNGPCCYMCKHALKDQTNLKKPYFFENGSVYEKLTFKNCSKCKCQIKEIHTNKLNDFLNLKLDNNISGFCDNCNSFIKNNEIIETYENKKINTQLTSNCLCDWRDNNMSNYTITKF